MQLVLFKHVVNCGKERNRFAEVPNIFLRSSIFAAERTKFYKNVRRVSREEPNRDTKHLGQPRVGLRAVLGRSLIKAVQLGTAAHLSLNALLRIMMFSSNTWFMITNQTSVHDSRYDPASQ